MNIIIGISWPFANRKLHIGHEDSLKKYFNYNAINKKCPLTKIKEYHTISMC